MKKPAISLILASLNLLLIGLYCLASWRKVGCCGWGSPGNIIVQNERGDIDFLEILSKIGLRERLDPPIIPCSHQRWRIPFQFL
jgi:hypothetical protein